MKDHCWTSLQSLNRALSRGRLLGASCALAIGGVAFASSPLPSITQDTMGEVMMIKLQGGQFQWGAIEDHSPETLSFRRMDTGGLVVVPWTMVEPNQELDLRSRFGYVDLSGDEVMITAEKLILIDGREVIGRVTGRETNVILFQTQGRVIQVPKTYVKSHVAGLLVPALDVLSKDELYQDQVTATELTDPAGHFELAVFCERILDFKRALEHYRLARELDPTFKSKEISATLARVEIKVANQEQVDFLANIDRLSRRDKFVDAFEQLILFDANYPDSPLFADRVKLETRVEKARTVYMREAVAELWFSWMSRLASKTATSKDFQSTIAYVDDGMSEEIQQKVIEGVSAKWPDLEEDQVRQFFLDRKLGRWKPSSYGLGTWLLGKEAAEKGEELESETRKPISDREKELSRRADQINAWLRNQQTAKRSRRSAEDEEELEDAWKRLPMTTRRTWIVAYYAENSGDLMVRPKPEKRDCHNCGGTGVKYEILSGFVRDGASAGERQIPCPTCHTIGFVRRIRYR